MTIQLGKKYTYSRDYSKPHMNIDYSYDTPPYWPMQVIDGPYEDLFDDTVKWVVRYNDGKMDLLPKEQIESLREIGVPEDD